MNKSKTSDATISFYITITLIFFTLSTSIFAQGNKNLDYLALYVGDTLYGKVEYIAERIPREFHKRIVVITTDGRVKKYKRKNVASFKVENNIYESFLLSQTAEKFRLVDPKFNIDNNNGKQYFLKVISKGNLSHYELEWIEQGEAALRSMDLLKKNTDLFFIRATQGVFGLKRKVTLDYFFNCAKIKEAISQKQVSDVRDVVDFYNKHCAD